MLDEDRNFYIDQMGNSGMRMPVLELGRRRADRGALAAPDGGSLHSLAAQRHATLQCWGNVVPPHAVGTPPEQDFDDPLIVSCIKTDLPPQARTNAPGIVRGTAASPGLARAAIPIDQRLHAVAPRAGRCGI